MNQIRVQYWYNGQPYRLDEGKFKKDDLLAYSRQAQLPYIPFADQINSVGGWLDVTLLPDAASKNGVCFESVLTGIPSDLKSEIESKLAQAK